MTTCNLVKLRYSGDVFIPFKICTKLIIAFFAIIFPFLAIVGAIALYNANTIRNASLKAEAVSEELDTVLSLQLAIDKSLMPGNDYIISGDKNYFLTIMALISLSMSFIEGIFDAMVLLGRCLWCGNVAISR